MPYPVPPARHSRAAWLLCVLGALGCAQSRAASEAAGAGAGSGTAADGPLTEDDYEAALAEAMCGLSERCCERAGLRLRASCTEWSLEGAQHWRPDPSSGARFDADAAAACVDGFAGLECTLAKVGRAQPEACAHVYEPGRRKLGERCTENSSFECAPSDAGETVCTLTRFREPVESTCVVTEYKEEGEPCLGGEEPNVWTVCAGRLICDEELGVCVRPAERGERCITGSIYGDTCAQGSVCDRTRSRRCIEPLRVGDPCDPSDDRCESLACIGGRCREPLFDLGQCEP